MTERVKHDDSIAEPKSGYIVEPIIVVHRIDEKHIGHIINLGIVDDRADNPTMFGILLSDLIDQIVDAYVNATGRDERDVHAQLMKAIEDENRFKQKDPSRGNQRGKLFVHRQ